MRPLHRLVERYRQLRHDWSELKRLQRHTANLIEQTLIPELRKLSLKLTAGRIQQSALLARAISDRLPDRRPETNYAPAKAKRFEEYLDDLHALDSVNFPAWRRLFERGAGAYRTEREASCSCWGDDHAEAFRAFVTLFARGRVLDVGCGIYGTPMYLEGYDAELISGLEPLDMAIVADFELVRGFGEFLPWPDASFSTVISATSLDHALSLDRSLAEVERVLGPDGRFLLWLASVQGAKAYEPSKGRVEPVDEFHMFHFDLQWFEPELRRRFVVRERISLPTPSFDHVFFCLERRRPTTARA